MKYFICLILFTQIPTSLASTWKCRNNDLEIRCTMQKCTISEEFTPMSVSVSSTGLMTACAYSGCWEGPGNIHSSGNYSIVTGHGLDFSNLHTGHNPTDFLIVIDRSDKVAIVKGFDFAMPMNCVSK